MPSFVPVQDPEKARCEQDEESLRKHRQFDTPFALLPKDLNNPKEKKGDLNPIARRSEELYQDENKLWKKKREVFDKQQTWGRETAIWSNPEETREQDKRKYKPGEVFWGAKGTFGGKQEDSGLLTLQRGEVDQTMELNEKGLWVHKKKPTTEEGPGLSSSAKQLLKTSSNGEDPRLEAAKPKGRGTADASEKALEALQERRKLERKVQDELGMTNKGKKPQHQGPITTLNSSSQQCKPSKRHAGMKRWQGVQRSDEEAREVVEKALGSCAVGGEVPKRIEPSGTGKRNRSPSPLAVSSPSGSDGEKEDGKFEAAWMDSDDEREAAKLNQKPSGGDIVVDFF